MVIYPYCGIDVQLGTVGIRNYYKQHKPSKQCQENKQKKEEREKFDEEKTICCKQKGCERSWVSQLVGCTCQLWLTHELCSIIFYEQAPQVSSKGFQGGFVSCASI